MRFKTSMIIFAGALLASTPALAQNEAGPTNDTAVTDANTVSMEGVPTTTDATGVAGAPVANDATALPPPMDETTVETTVDETAPVEEERGFPWGVLGLLGLLGLIPRLRRS